jgi:CDP-diacylglycerol pyrophosphatase
MHGKVRNYLLIGIAASAALMFVTSAMGQKGYGSKSSTNSTDSPIDPEKPVGRSALRQIVQTQCVIHWQQRRSAAPCEKVFLADSNSNGSGYAILADFSGGAHYLLVPTQTMGGIESSELLDPDAPNYFAQAWHARSLLTAYVGHEVPRNAIGLVVGIARSRTQDQFHIHIECLKQDVAKALRASAADITDAWSPIDVLGSKFAAMRIQSESLDSSNLFELVATLQPDARHHLADYTIVVAGMQLKGEPGFIVLAGTGPSGEILLDSTCAVAGGGSGDSAGAHPIHP